MYGGRKPCTGKSGSPVVVKNRKKKFFWESAVGRMRCAEKAVTAFTVMFCITLNESKKLRNMTIRIDCCCCHCSMSSTCAVRPGFFFHLKRAMMQRRTNYSTGKTFVSVYVHSILTRASRSSFESSFFLTSTRYVGFRSPCYGCKPSLLACRCSLEVASS